MRRLRAIVKIQAAAPATRWFEHVGLAPHRQHGLLGEFLGRGGGDAGPQHETLHPRREIFEQSRKGDAIPIGGDRANEVAPVGLIDRHRVTGARECWLPRHARSGRRRDPREREQARRRRREAWHNLMHVDENDRSRVLDHPPVIQKGGSRVSHA